MRFLLPILVLVLLLAGCRRDSAPDADVLARVGGDIITAEMFRMNYAFGHGHLRQGTDPKQTYLDLMIAEVLLAQEAERLGLDTAQAITQAERTLREELRIERVFEAHVLEQIDVTDAEIRDEINRAAVHFQFRFLPAITESQAHTIRSHWKAEGFEATVAREQAQLVELGAVLNELTSPLVGAEDIDPAVLAVIQDLERGVPSEPVQLGDLWYVFEVTDIRQRRLAESDYTAQAPTYRKVVYNRKAMQGATDFVAATMEPLHVTTKRTGFDILNAALWAWYSDATPSRNLLSLLDQRDTDYARLLREHADETLVTFGTESWTIQTFLEHFTPGRYILRAQDPDAFRARLADIVALVVRDAVFLQMAQDEKLDRNPATQQTLAQWKTSWRFQELRSHLVEHDADEATLRTFYADAAQTQDTTFIPFDNLSADQREQLQRRWTTERLTMLADSLRQRTRVVINTAMLDTLTIPFAEKNPLMTVQLVKNNANKAPLPIVDPNWRPRMSRSLAPHP